MRRAVPNTSRYNKIVQEYNRAIAFCKELHLQSYRVTPFLGLRLDSRVARGQARHGEFLSRPVI